MLEIKREYPADSRIAKLLEEEQKSKARYVALQQIGTEITRLSSLDHVLQIVVQYAREILNADLAAIGLLENKQTQLHIRVVDGAQTNSLEGRKTPFGNGIGWVSIQESRPIVSNDYVNDPRHKSTVIPALQEERVKAGVVAPLQIGDKAIGVLYVFNRQITDWPDDSGMLLLGLANQAAIAIENARVYSLEKEHVRRLEELDQLKNEFISVASHEFRNPLTIIKGVVDFLLLGEEGNIPVAQRGRLLKQIGDEAMRLNELVGDVLEVSRIESSCVNLHLVPINLADVIGEVAELWSTQAKTRNIDITLNIEQPPIVFADAGRTRQILINLLSNAIKYSPDGTSVRIEVRAVERYAHVDVIDQGVGITPEQIPYLFGKFNRLSNPRKDKVKGTGLGLYIAKSLAEVQGGSISVESIPGHGSRFTFTLPLA